MTFSLSPFSFWVSRWDRGAPWISSSFCETRHDQEALTFVFQLGQPSLLEEGEGVWKRSTNVYKEWGWFVCGVGGYGIEL